MPMGSLMFFGSLWPLNIPSYLKPPTLFRAGWTLAIRIASACGMAHVTLETMIVQVLHQPSRWNIDISTKQTLPP